MIESERARAERLGHLTQSPGWPDLVKILNDLVNEQVTAVNAFAGWDKDQKADLMTRQQTVIQMRDELIRRVEKILLAQFAPSDNNTEQDATLADELRRKIMNETRIPGTYEV